MLLIERVISLLAELQLQPQPLLCAAMTPLFRAPMTPQLTVSSTVSCTTPTHSLSAHLDRHFVLAAPLRGAALGKDRHLSAENAENPDEAANRTELRKMAAAEAMEGAPLPTLSDLGMRHQVGLVPEEQIRCVCSICVDTTYM